MTTISLFYYCETAFVLANIRMIGKNSMKRHYLKKMIFIVTKKWEILLMHIMRTQKDLVKVLKSHGESHDLYIQIDTLLLAEVFENFRNMYI